jgi:hypothetical protein
MLSFWDEASTFFGSFGLYESGDAKSYDRSIFLELYNGPKKYKRDLASQRLTIHNPRFNLCLLGKDFINCAIILFIIIFC